MTARNPAARPRNDAPMSGGEAIARALIDNGVDTVFGLPGAQMYPFFDALHRLSDKITTYGARHEQGTGYAAFGYAKSTGRPGVFSVVPGPGVMIFDDYIWSGTIPRDPILCPKIAIDAFCNINARKLNFVAAPISQVYIQKIAS